MDKMAEFGLENRLQHWTAGSIAVGRLMEKVLWLTHAIMAINSMEQLVSCQNDRKEGMWNVSAWCINQESFGQNWIARKGVSKVVALPSLAFHLSLMWFCVTGLLHIYTLPHLHTPSTIPDPCPEICAHAPEEITEHKTHFKCLQIFHQDKIAETLDRLAIVTFWKRDLFQ